MPFQSTHAFELDSALHPLAGEHCVDSASRRPSGMFDLDSAPRPLAGEHCVDSASRKPSGTLELHSALRPLAGEHCVDLSSHGPSGTIELDSASHQLVHGSGSVAESVLPVQPTHVSITSSTKQSHSSTSQKCIQLNARSLNNKFLSFHNLIYSDSDDIIVITESWWRSNNTKAFIDRKNKYNIFRLDRVRRQGGGVCILTAKCLNAVQVQFTANIDTVLILMSAVLFTDSLPLTDHLVLLLITLIIMSVLMTAW